MSASLTAAPPARSTPARYGIALAVVVAGQTMILIDEMIVNIALPGMSAELALDPVALSWVINAYLLTFGGLLLLGGRAGDILGRRKVFLAGVALFSVACLARGLATEPWMLITARAVQGVGAALTAPCVLALIVSMFAEGPLRRRAIAVYTAVGGLGAALGLLLAGTLTSASSWRWVLMLNVPIGALVLLCAPFVVRETEPNPGRFDVAGALTSALGVGALVWALSAAGSEGWGSPTVQGLIAAGVVLLLAFVAIERRARQPIVVPRLFADRNRVCAYLAVLLVQGSQIGQLFFLTQFFQQGLGFSPLVAALAFLPVTVTLLALAGAVVKLQPKVGARPLVVLGAAMLVASNLLLSRLDLDTTYATDVLPALLLLGAGIALGTIPATVLGTSGVDDDETGSASSMISATTTLGASLALAVLVTVMTAASTRAAGSVPADLPQEAIGGYVFLRGMSASFVAGGAFALATLVVALFIRRSTNTRPTPVGPDRP
ncbi:MFS transporter [Micromonospora okii]|uniref:Efflux protein n=1 Tax=Micromonospora okii TaxID=1182970 RepID=A0A023GUM0_9ACTN|nr:MFS transporter [Micromonospora okii]AFJ52714.1 efflux protein [Micromonospora okii]